MRERDEVNFLDWLIMLAKWKKWILGIPLLVGLLAAAFSMTMTSIYTATVKIMPPKQERSSAGALMGQLGALAGVAGAGAGLGLKDPNQLYVSMLMSRAIGEKMISRFGLQSLYSKQTMDETLFVLGKVTAVETGKDGVITVKVDSKDPNLAANMANAYAEELNVLLRSLAITAASQQRGFFEVQMKAAKDKLTDAELALDRTPRTSLQYLDAVRNLKYQEAVWEILAKQFEASKLEESKDFPVIQVLDAARVPEKKSKPSRMIFTLVCAVVAFILTLIWALVREALSRARQDAEQAVRLELLRRYLKWRN